MFSEKLKQEREHPARIRRAELRRDELGDWIWTHNGVEYHFTPRCAQTGRREVLFGAPGQVCDTSAPIGANPVATLREVHRTLSGLKMAFWFTGGNSRLDRFYEKMIPSMRIN